MGTPYTLDEDGFRKQLASTLQKGHVNATPAQMDKFVALYNARVYAGSWKKAAIDFDTDAMFNCGSRTVLNENSKKGQPTFSYHLMHAWGPEQLYPCLGVPHATDVIFLFENIPGLSKDEQALGKRMIKYWSDFAKNHKPSDSWPAYDVAKQQYLSLDVPDDTALANWHRDQCDMIDEIMKLEDLPLVPHWNSGPKPNEDTVLV